MHPNQYQAFAPQCDRLLTIKEVCERLRCSRSTIYLLIGSKRLKSIRLNARRYVRLSDLSAFIASLSSDGEGN